MNIEFIKSEFEKLTLILRSWKEDHNISAIERDIVLDKLKNIYDAVRFADADADTAGTDMADSHTAVQAAQQPAVPVAVETAPAAPTTDADSDTSDKEEEQGEAGRSRHDGRTRRNSRGQEYGSRFRRCCG